MTPDEHRVLAAEYYAKAERIEKNTGGFGAHQTDQRPARLLLKAVYHQMAASNGEAA